MTSRRPRTDPRRTRTATEPRLPAERFGDLGDHGFGCLDEAAPGDLDHDPAQELQPVPAHRVALEGPIEVMADPADALDGDPPRARVGEVDEVPPLGMVDRVLVDRRREAGRLEEDADPPGELRAGGGGAVPREEHVPVAP